MIYCHACNKENMHMFPKKQTLTQGAIFGKVHKFCYYFNNSFFLLSKQLVKIKYGQYFFEVLYLLPQTVNTHRNNFNCPAGLMQITPI